MARDFTKEHEDAALEIGNNKAKLVRRFKDALSVMNRQVRETFGEGTLDFKNKRLVGENGMVLQWKLRKDETRPESPDNQQTTIGNVYFVNARRGQMDRKAMALELVKLAKAVMAKTEGWYVSKQGWPIDQKDEVEGEAKKLRSIGYTVNVIRDGRWWRIEFMPD